MKKTTIILAGLLGAVASTASAAPTKITFEKPAQRWLWGGFGFHNSETSMSSVMTDEFRNERVYKTFREISPTYSRVFAGYFDWTKEAMDAFADYYDATFRQAGTTLYVVPGRMPVITEDFDIDRYCEDVATRLEYIVKTRKCTKVRYYAVSNELSVGPTYCWFGKGHWDVYIKLMKGLQRAFVRHGLDIGLMGPDSSGYSRTNDISWALTNVYEQVEVYCWHLYERTNKTADPTMYNKLYSTVSNLTSTCLRREKRLSVGEFGFTGRIVGYGDGIMRDDAHGGFRKPGSVFAREAAISRAEMGLAVLNGGALHGVTWTMVDYPDPFLRENGDTPAEKAWYSVARFSGYGLDVRYNKNGLFRWCDEERDYSAYPDLYTMGYLVKLFRRGARVLKLRMDDVDLRACGVTNPDGSASFALINWADRPKDVEVTVEHRLGKPLRVYEYISATPPENKFNDLQPAKGTIAALATAQQGSSFVAALPPRSISFFTTDYVERTPPPVKDVQICDGRLEWTASEDPDHCYYRVYANGQQIASTVATSFNRSIDTAATYSVRSVDRWGNLGAEGKEQAACAASLPKIIFDTDMFSDYDDVGALAVLHKLADEGKCEILATVTSTRDNQSVAMCEVLNGYFGRPSIPVGAPTAPAVSEPSSGAYRAVVEKYAKHVRHMNASDAEDAVRVYRRILAAANDQSVTVCIVGFMTNFRRLLESGADDLSPLSGRELVSRKVREAVIVGFMFPRGREYNIYCDPSAARYVLENCPVPMVFSGWEFGCDVFSGRKASEVRTGDDPVKDMFARCLLSREAAAKAHRFDHDPEGMGHNSYDQTAVLAAVLGDCDYFALERGTVKMVGEKGDNVWRSNPDGPHARLVPRMPKRALSAYIDDLMARGALLSHHGVLCLTFDDGLFDCWRPVLPLFAKYGAHATFYALGEITPAREAAMREFRAAGHSVGIHTVHHREPPIPCAGRQATLWYEKEVLPQLSLTNFPITTLAYPNNRDDAESDMMLEKVAGITKFRTGAMDCNYRGPGPVADFAQVEMGFVPVDARRGVRALWSFGIGPTQRTNSYYRTTRENVFGALKRAAARNEIVTFFSHSIRPGNTDAIGMETEFLEDVLKEAKRLGMRIVGVEELDR